jgi:hypothetical protein
VIGAAAAAQPGEDMSIRPFTFRASDEALSDLKRRIAATKWPNKELVSDASQGVQLATMHQALHLLVFHLPVGSRHGLCVVEDRLLAAIKEVALAPSLESFHLFQAHAPLDETRPATPLASFPAMWRTALPVRPMIQSSPRGRQPMSCR